MDEEAKIAFGIGERLKKSAAAVTEAANEAETLLAAGNPQAANTTALIGLLDFLCELAEKG